MIHYAFYYVDPTLQLIQVSTNVYGNQFRPICKLAPRHHFEVFDGQHVAAVNFYDDFTLFYVDGHFTTLQEGIAYHDVVLRFDAKKNQWACIIEKTDGSHRVMIMDKGQIKADVERLRFTCHTDHICFDNDTLFLPSDGAIRAFQPAANVYKDFPVALMTDEHQLIRLGNKFYSFHSLDGLGLVYEIG
jgi:hypothetical protein